jgi:type III secretory pathway component EscR
VLVSSNSGFTFRNSFNLRTNMLKNKLALIFSGYNTTPAYTLINKTISYPSLNLEVESNFFKDKLNARIGYRDMFALNTVRKISSNFDSFRQLINNHNKTTNIVFSLAYNFGKVFNDRMNSREIENSDIIVK